MTKISFILALHDKLSHLPQSEVEERLNFYSEMIEDRMEDGLSEEEAVLAVGNVDEIAEQIISDISSKKPQKDKALPKKKFKVWEIIFLALTSPVWISLLIAAFAVILSVYASVWAIIVSLWAVFISLIACTVAGAIAGIGFIFSGYAPSGIAMISAGISLSGLSIFAFFGCKAATEGILLLTKKTALWIKNRFGKKEEA